MLITEWINSCVKQGTANLDSASHLFPDTRRSDVRQQLAQLGFAPDPSNYKKMILTPQKKPVHAITSYVVGTEVNADAFKMFIRFCEARDYCPIIIPINYKNPTSLEEAIAQESDESPASWIDPKVKPFLKSDRYDHSPAVVVLADIKAQITAVKPLRGLESLSRGKSAVVAHVTQQLISVPRMLPSLPVIMATTGTISDLKYASNLAAKKAEFHTIHGCVVVDEGETKIRHVVFDSHDGVISAFDQGFLWDLNGQKKPYTFLASLGDVHFGSEDPEAVRWALEICKETQAEHVLLHDTFDGQTINHHTVQDADRFERFLSVAEEVGYHNQQIKTIEGELDACVHLVESNHNGWLKKWMEQTHPVTLRSAAEKEIYAKVLTNQAVLTGNLLESGTKLGNFMIFHGHESVNGGKLSDISLARIGSKVIYGHTHAPAQFQGVSNGGCLCILDQKYTRGSLTSWAQGLVLASPSGKRQVLVRWS